MHDPDDPPAVRLRASELLARSEGCFKWPRPAGEADGSADEAVVPAGKHVELEIRIAEVVAESAEQKEGRAGE